MGSHTKSSLIFCNYFTTNQHVYQCECSALLTWTDRRFRPSLGFIMLCTMCAMEMHAIENDTAQL